MLSVAAQGLTMRWAARTLGLIEAHPVPRLAEMDSATLSTLHSELVELRAEDLGIRAGTLVRDAELPGAAIIVAIRRDQQIVRPRGSSELAGDDHLYLLVASERLSDVQRALDLVETRRRRPALGRPRALLGLAPGCAQAEQVLQPPAAAATSSPSALKLEPQPQDATALGLLTVNPWPMRPSTKSTSAPLR